MVPALRHAVEAAGERRVNVSDAAKVVDQPAEVQEQALDRVLRGDVQDYLQRGPADPKRGGGSG